MPFLDIHTHHTAITLGDESIRNLSPTDFATNTPTGFCSVGIHPWQAAEATTADFEQLRQAAGHPLVVAIGESGLDKLSTAPLALQQQLFEQQITLSETVKKPLLIHCVKAFNELIVIKRHFRPKQPWVVHGFRNNPNIARTLLAEGFFLSLGEKYHPEVPSLLSPRQWLTETDESSVPIRTLIRRLAERLDISPDDLAKQIDENARSIFFR